MAELDETTLRALAGTAGLPLQFVYKESKLFEVLSKIMTANKEAGYDIVLKGGTALNKVYFKGTQRFSEDIDFDMFTENAKLERIVDIDGFEMQGPWKIRNTLRFHLKYLFFGREDNVRVEFSTNKLLKTLNPIATESMTSEVTGTALFGIPCYSFDDLVARKMNALRTRAEGKDIWDCYHALPKTKDIKTAIKFALQSERLDMRVEDSLNETLLKLKKVDPKETMKLTNQYIPTSLRPNDWEEVIQTVYRQVEQLL